MSTVHHACHPAALLAVIVALAAGGRSLPAAERDAAPAPSAPASLATRAARFPTLRTATADFTQEREVSLVDEVLRARGTLALAAPASFRLDLVEPDAMALVAAGPTMTVVDAAGTPLPLPAEFAGFAAFARTLTDLLLGNRPPAGFRETWRDTDTVVLTPSGEAASPFTEITLAFAPDGPLPATITLREHGGDRTTIRLTRVALNPTIDPARFQSPSSKGS